MVNLLWAALAIPIVIHLVHRRRAKRMLFSTLRFLRMVDQRVARRQRLKEWLLLMARLLLVAAVVGAIYHRTVGGMDGGRAQVAVAIVLDDSCSMRAVRGGATRFAHMRRAAGAMLQNEKGSSGSSSSSSAGRCSPALCAASLKAAPSSRGESYQRMRAGRPR